MCFRCDFCGRRECSEPPYDTDEQHFMLTDAFWSYQHPKMSVGWVVVHFQRIADRDSNMVFFSFFNGMRVCEMCSVYFKSIGRVPSLVLLAAAAVYEAGNYEWKTKSAFRSLLVRKRLKDVARRLSDFGHGLNRCIGANDPDDSTYIAPHVTAHVTLPLVPKHWSTCMRPVNSKKKTRVYLSQQCVSCMNKDKNFKTFNFTALRKRLRFLEQQEKEMVEH